MNDMSKREEFLIAMYNQLMNDINRHIVIIWQSITTIVASFAVFSIVEKGYINQSIAITIILVLMIWLLLHIYDAAFWYNRNLVIIANIERVFLEGGDGKLIHHYFLQHRSKNKMLSHLAIQRHLAVVGAVLLISWHFFIVVLPDISFSSELDFSRVMPYLAMILLLQQWRKVHVHNKARYDEFLRESPGKDISAEIPILTYSHSHSPKGFWKKLMWEVWPVFPPRCPPEQTPTSAPST